MKKKIIFVSGNFNILHPGHLRLLQFAKKLGSYLVVGVNNDTIAGKSAYIKQNLRVNNVKNLNFVNEVILIKNLKSFFGSVMYFFKEKVDRKKLILREGPIKAKFRSLYRNFIRRCRMKFLSYNFDRLDNFISRVFFGFLWET